MEREDVEKRWRPGRTRMWVRARGAEIASRAHLEARAPPMRRALAAAACKPDVVASHDRPGLAVRWWCRSGAAKGIQPRSGSAVICG